MFLNDPFELKLICNMIFSNIIDDPMQTTAFSLVYLLIYFLYCKNLVVDNNDWAHLSNKQKPGLFKIINSLKWKDLQFKSHDAWRNLGSRQSCLVVFLCITQYLSKKVFQFPSEKMIWLLFSFRTFCCCCYSCCSRCTFENLRL